MDTIDVQKVLFTSEDGNYSDEYVALVLNGEVIKRTFDVWGFCMATAFGPKLVTWEILTCSCGHAGCAGIWDGTMVKQRRYTVEWRDIDSGLPKRFYSFDKTAYHDTSKKAFQFMWEIAAKREEDGADPSIHYGVMSACTVDDFWRRWECSKKWYGKYG